MSDKISKKAKEIEEGIEKFKSKDAPTEFQKDRSEGERVFAEIVGGVIFGAFSGYFIDDYFKTAPVFIIIFVILGLAGSVYNIYKASEK